MNPLFIILIVIAVSLVGIYFFLRLRNQRWYNKILDESKSSLDKIYKESSALLRPLYLPLESNKSPAPEDINRLAADPRTRFKLYEALHAYHKTDMFPSGLYSHEALAESQLVFNMQHVHALGGVPDEIRIEEKVSFNRGGKGINFYVFRIKPKPNVSNRFGNKQWVRGICGPYKDHHPAHRQAFHIQLDADTDNVSAQDFCEKAYDNNYREPGDEVKKLLNLI